MGLEQVFQARADYKTGKTQKGAFYDTVWSHLTIISPAQAIMGVPLTVYRIKDKGQLPQSSQATTLLRAGKFTTVAKAYNLDYEIVTPSHPAYSVLHPPNENDLSLQVFIRNTIMKYLSNDYGAVWHIKKKNGVPHDVILLDNPTPIYNQKRKIEKWSYVDGSEYKEIPVKDTVNFYLYDPITGGYFSRSTLLAQTTKMLSNINIWNSGIFDGETIPPIIITVKQWLNDKVREKIRNGFSKFLAPLKDRIGILEGDASVFKLFDTKDFDFQGANEILREEILAAGSIPPALAGVYKHATYNNSEAQQEIFWTLSNVPIMQYLKEVINNHIFFPYWDDVIIDWSWEDLPKFYKKEMIKEEGRYRKYLADEKQLQVEILRRQLENGDFDKPQDDFEDNDTFTADNTDDDTVASEEFDKETDISKEDMTKPHGSKTYKRLYKRGRITAQSDGSNIKRYFTNEMLDKILSYYKRDLVAHAHKKLLNTLTVEGDLLKDCYHIFTAGYLSALKDMTTIHIGEYPDCYTQSFYSGMHDHINLYFIKDVFGEEALTKIEYIEENTKRALTNANINDINLLCLKLSTSLLSASRAFAFDRNNVTSTIWLSSKSPIDYCSHAGNHGKMLGISDPANYIDKGHPEYDKGYRLCECLVMPVAFKLGVKNGENIYACMKRAYITMRSF